MFADNISAVIECHQLVSALRIQSALDKTPVVGLLRNAWTKPTKQNTTHAITACTSLLSLDRCRANNQIWLIVSLQCWNTEPDTTNVRTVCDRSYQSGKNLQSIRSMMNWTNCSENILYENINMHIVFTIIPIKCNVIVNTIYYTQHCVYMVDITSSIYIAYELYLWFTRCTQR